MIKIQTVTKVVGQKLVNRIKAELAKYSEAYVTIGVHEGAGSYKDGQSVVEVALWNEFGTETIPERSFIRSTMDNQEEKINQLRDHALNQIVAGAFTIEKALEFMGLNIQMLIQNTIKSNMPPPNAPSTLKAKERKGVPARTLIETGLLLRSITYKVHLK